MPSPGYEVAQDAHHISLIYHINKILKKISLQEEKSLTCELLITGAV